MGCRLWGRTESNTTEATYQQQQHMVVRRIEYVYPLQSCLINKHAAAAAAASKSLQSCPTLCDPIDSSPPGSSVHGILQARVLEWGAIAFSNKHATVVIFVSSNFRCLWKPMTPFGVKYSCSHCSQFPTLTTGFQDEF